jgi:hypothetical protein
VLRRIMSLKVSCLFGVISETGGRVILAGGFGLRAGRSRWLGMSVSMEFVELKSTVVFIVRGGCRVRL